MLLKSVHLYLALVLESQKKKAQPKFKAKKSEKVVRDFTFSSYSGDSREKALEKKIESKSIVS